MRRTGLVAFLVLTLAPPLAGLMPSLAFAQTVSRAVGLFNIFVGLMLVAAFLAYGAGFVVWVTRLGSWPNFRTQGIHIMEWTPVILFVLIVLLAIVHFFQGNPGAAAGVLAVIVFLLIIWAILALMRGAKSEEDTRKKGEEEKDFDRAAGH